MTSSEKPDKERRPRVYEWELKLVLINYTGGPDPATPWDVKEGSLEAKAGVFGLAEVSDLGVMAEKLTLVDDEIQFSPVIFFPWGAIHSIKLFEADEGEEQEEFG